MVDSLGVGGGGGGGLGRSNTKLDRAKGWRRTFAPKYSLGGLTHGVTTKTSSPDSRRPLIRHSKRFFIPLMWLKGEGSTNSATFFGAGSLAPSCGSGESSIGNGAATASGLTADLGLDGLIAILLGETVLRSALEELAAE